MLCRARGGCSFRSFQAANCVQAATQPGTPPPPPACCAPPRPVSSPPPQAELGVGCEAAVGCEHDDGGGLEGVLRREGHLHTTHTTHGAGNWDGMNSAVMHAACSQEKKWFAGFTPAACWHACGTPANLNFALALPHAHLAVVAAALKIGTLGSLQHLRERGWGGQAMRTSVQRRSTPAACRCQPPARAASVSCRGSGGPGRGWACRALPVAARPAHVVPLQQVAGGWVGCDMRHRLLQGNRAGSKVIGNGGWAHARAMERQQGRHRQHTQLPAHLQDGSVLLLQPRNAGLGAHGSTCARAAQAVAVGGVA